MKCVPVVLAVILATMTVRARPPDQKVLAFEVASVKADVIGAGPIGVGIRGPEVHATTCRCGSSLNRRTTFDRCFIKGVLMADHRGWIRKGLTSGEKRRSHCCSTKRAQCCVGYLTTASACDSTGKRESNPCLRS